MKYTIGVDIGGTNIRVGLVLKDKVVSYIELPSQVNKGKWTVVRNILEAIKEIDGKNIKGIGVGAAGPLDIKNGIIKNAPNLPLKGVNLRRILRREFRVPVFLDNDSNGFTLAEALYGAGRRYSNVFGITLGTGVGGGIVVDKKIYRGKDNAGEIGHMIINFDGPRCSCGVKGHLEAYLGAKGVKTLTGLTPVQLYGKAITGDRKAIKAFEEYGTYLGMGICNIASSFDPDIVVVGGRIANAWKFFSRSMKSTIKELAFNQGVKVERAGLEYPSIIGAANLVDSK